MDLLRAVRPDVVKIASSMIGDLPGVVARSAVAAVVGTAHSIGARVVAKGIETAAQLDAVLFVGVDDAQGWEVGQPMRAPGSRISAER
jgi:EAL domain-containing protein (putative c-di-GMP-specific phosphodiesterase class I)